jgi:S-adenosylmethionine hydrolase
MRHHRACERPVISLLTDFGLEDTFVAQVKAVILGMAPGAQLVDITHAVPPQDIVAGALALEAAWEAFPRGTVHLCVVDPGVGSNRLAVVVHAGGHLFVAPDNGLLTPVFRRFPGASARVVEHSDLHGPNVSHTFHGRDLFAVTAARLSTSFPFERVGRLMDRPVLLPAMPPEDQDAGLAGQVIGFDRFGNAATNLLSGDLERTAKRLGTPIEAFQVSCHEICFGPIAQFYAQAPAGAPMALVSSAGRLELAVCCGSARGLGIRAGDAVTVAPVGCER